MKILASLLFVGVLAYAARPARESKLASDLEALTSGDQQSKVRVILQWKDAADDAKEQKILSRGGLVHSRLKSAKAGVYTLPAWAIQVA